MSTIYFIRHGQASAADADYDRLSEMGLRQSRLLGEYLQARGARFDAAVCGTLERQKATAQGVLACLTDAPPPDELQVDPGFDESWTMSLIGRLLPGLVKEDPSLAEDFRLIRTDNRAFKRVFQAAMLRWMSGDLTDPDLETYPEFVGRVEGATRRLMTPGDENIIVFTSGGPISTVMRWALGLANEVALGLNWRLPNCSMSVFRSNPARINLLSYNSVAHLEAAGDPSLITYR
ncbi:MAG: histidine phosphatase family protein [Proteobacteria bacterium]|nr:histidine phosphatase family protein [Pseudomonadota bacterium]